MTQPDFKVLDEQIRSTDKVVATTAASMLAQCADAGNVEAAGILSTVYSDGCSNVSPDLIKAYRYTEICAEAGDPFSRYWLARLQYRAGDFAAALKNARLAIDAGDNQAPTLVATMLIHGEGCTPSIMEGLSILEREAASSTDAQALLAQFFAFGEFVQENPSKAYEYIGRIGQGTFAYLARFNPQKAAELYFLKGVIAKKLSESGGACEAWRPLFEQAATLGHAKAKEALAAKIESVRPQMENTVSGGFTQSRLSDQETKITFRCMRPWAMACIGVGALVSITFVGMVFGIPLLFIGLIGAVLKKQGSIIVVRGQGIRFSGALGEVQIPFSDISRVGWRKTHMFFNVFDVTVDTRGKTVAIARGLPLAMAQDLQGFLLKA